MEKNDVDKLLGHQEKKDNSLVKITEALKNIGDSATKNLFCISYLLFENGKVSMILIGDYQYAMNMK